MFEEFQDELVVWTIRIAMIMMFLSLTFRRGWKPVQAAELSTSEPAESKVSGVPKWQIELAQHSWLLGSLFALLHTLVTLFMVFEGSHAAAYEHTADTTEAYLGIRVGFGIYANHIFVVVWLADAMTWLAAPDLYQRRALWIDYCVVGFLFFIAINGTIVFAAGPIRWYAIVAFSMLAIYWIVQRRFRKTA